MTIQLYRVFSDFSSVDTAPGLVLLGLIYFTSRAIYAICLHPLHRYPGPKLAAITPIPQLAAEIKGTSHLWIRKLHDKYGDVVRIGPNELVYRAPQAWKDIYGHRKKGQRTFAKDPQLYVPTPNGTDAIITAQEGEHTRVRRLLAHAFSRKALLEQEPLLHTYADLLVQRLHEKVATPMVRVLDINQWYNFTTFDLIGDLAFGESFQCLENSEYHWWVTIMFYAVKLSVYVKLLWFFPVLKLLGKLPLPSYLVERRQASFQLAVAKVTRRMKRQTDRPDFMSYILKHNENQNGLSVAEIEANAATFVLAGSETTAALLSGCTYYLLKSPAKYSRLVGEIRGAFHRPEGVSLSTLANLPYLNAVLEESLRVYPPIPTMLPRLVPDGGAIINGKFVPDGTSVSMSLWSTFHSSTNFTDPDAFIPERGLPNAETKYAADNKGAFQPFSYGPRNCLGQHLAHAEMRLILAKVLLDFDLELMTESDGWAIQEQYNLWSRPPLMVRLFRAGNGG